MRILLLWPDLLLICCVDRIIFAVVFLLNLFLLVAGSSGAVPFGTMLAIAVLWFGISAPLSAIGAYYGSKHGVCLDEGCATSFHADAHCRVYRTPSA